MRFPPRQTCRGRTERSGLGAGRRLERRAAGKERERIAVRKEGVVGERWQLGGGLRILRKAARQRMERSTNPNLSAKQTARAVAHSPGAPLSLRTCNEYPFPFPYTRFCLVSLGIGLRPRRLASCVASAGAFWLQCPCFPTASAVGYDMPSLRDSLQKPLGPRREYFEFRVFARFRLL